MANSAVNTRCTWTCWIVSALAGLLTAFLLNSATSMTGWGAFFCGLVIAIVLAFFLPLIFCRSDDHGVSHGIGTAAATGAGAVAAGAGAVAAGASRGATAVSSGASAAGDAAADAAAKAKAPADAAAAKAAAEAKAKADAATKAAADAKAKADAAAKKTATAAKTKADNAAKAAKEAELDAKLGVDYDGDGVREGANEGTRPAALKGPRGGKADDLKMIKGVGPKMEKMCNGLGFYHFDQIAAWSPAEVAWVDANLEGFKGRVTRDTWVAQAKLLAAGGETAFSKKVGKGDVY